MPAFNPQDFKTLGEFCQHVSTDLENDTGRETGTRSEDVILMIEGTECSFPGAGFERFSPF